MVANLLHFDRADQKAEATIRGPTGLDVWGNTFLVAQAGPVPHSPANGRVVAFTPRAAGASVVAAGGPLMVDVKRGRGATLFALAQGTWDGAFEGSPALPNTGQLLRVNGDGTVSVRASGLNIVAGRDVAWASVLPFRQ